MRITKNRGILSPARNLTEEIGYELQSLFSLRKQTDPVHGGHEDLLRGAGRGSTGCPLREMFLLQPDLLRRRGVRNGGTLHGDHETQGDQRNGHELLREHRKGDRRGPVSRCDPEPETMKKGAADSGTFFA